MATEVSTLPEAVTMMYRQGHNLEIQDEAGKTIAILAFPRGEAALSFTTQIDPVNFAKIAGTKLTRGQRKRQQRARATAERKRKRDAHEAQQARARAKKNPHNSFLSSANFGGGTF